jgi:hypothetical protein
LRLAEDGAQAPTVLCVSHDIDMGSGARRDLPTRGALIVAAAISLGLAPPQAQRGLAAGAGPFDGMWSVKVDSPDVGKPASM